MRLRKVTPLVLALGRCSNSPCCSLDLPPDRIARPLPTGPAPKSKAKPRQTSTTKRAKPAPDRDVDGGAAPHGTKRKRQDSKHSVGRGVSRADDAPRAFKRLMALASGKRVRSGLDDGVVETKKQKKARLAAAAAATVGAAGGGQPPKDGKEEKDADASANAPAPAPLKIRPGERLADFGRRVDAALPLIGATSKSAALPGSHGNKDPLGIAKTFRTRQERKLHRLYDQWRVDDQRLKDREAEALELEEERAMELDETLGVRWRLEASVAKKGGKDDIWAEFDRKKGAATQSTVRAGIHGVVGAPPELTKINTNKYRFARHTAQPANDAGVDGDMAAAREEVLTSYQSLAEARRRQRQQQRERRT